MKRKVNTVKRIKFCQGSDTWIILQEDKDGLLAFNMWISRRTVIGTRAFKSLNLSENWILFILLEPHVTRSRLNTDIYQPGQTSLHAWSMECMLRRDVLNSKNLSIWNRRTLNSLFFFFIDFWCAFSGSTNWKMKLITNWRVLIITSVVLNHIVNTCLTTQYCHLASTTSGSFLNR